MVAALLQRSGSGSATGSEDKPAESETQRVPCTGGFISIGRVPATAFLSNQLELSRGGYIKRQPSSDSDGPGGGYTTMTSVEGVFACGDVADGRYAQAVTAAGTGAQAAMDAHQWAQHGRTSDGGAVAKK